MMTSRSYVYVFLLMLSLTARAYPDTANYSTWILALSVFFGPAAIIFSFFLLWVYLSLNTSIFQDLSEVGVLGKYITIFCAYIYYIINFRKIIKDTKAIKIIFFSICFLLVLVVHSLLVSSNPFVSISKATLWISVVMTLFISWHFLSEYEKKIVFNRLFYLIVLLLVSSIFIIPYDVSRAVNGLGLQGVLNHPQVFGITAAIGCVLLLVFLRENNANPLYSLLMPIFFYLLCESLSRTAIFSFLFSIAIVSPFYCYKFLKRGTFIRDFFGIFCLGSLCAIVIFFGEYSKHSTGFVQMKEINSPITKSDSTNKELSLPTNDIVDGTVITKKSGRRNILEKLIFKDSKTEDISNVYLESRGGLIVRALDDIKNHPFFGKGFGIGEVDLSKIKYAPYTDLEISYPVEKGMIFFAVMQEVGIIGLILFFCLILYLLRRNFYNISSRSILILVMLFINMGEFIFFSTGGSGMLLMIFFTYIALISHEKIH